MNKSDFDYFMALYNTESISEAAMVCHTDKSTISKSIINNQPIFYFLHYKISNNANKKHYTDNL